MTGPRRTGRFRFCPNPAMVSGKYQMRSGRLPMIRLLMLALVPATLAACATVKVEAPDKPIEINLNVKIEQEVRIRLDKDVEDLIASNPDIF